MLNLAGDYIPFLAHPSGVGVQVGAAAWQQPNL